MVAGVTEVRHSCTVCHSAQRAMISNVKSQPITANSELHGMAGSAVLRQGPHIDLLEVAGSVVTDDRGQPVRAGGHVPWKVTGRDVPDQLK